MQAKAGSTSRQGQAARSEDVLRIKDLTPCKPRCKIRACVLKKTEITEWRTTLWMNVFFQDESGKILGAASGEHAQPVYDKIKDNFEYEVCAFKIKRKKQTMRFPSASPFYLLLDSGTVFRNPRPVERTFKFTNIAELPMEKDLLDVIGVVQSVEDTFDAQKNVRLLDHSGAEAGLKLLETQARDFKGREGSILAVQNALVNPRKAGQLQTCNWTVLEVNPKFELPIKFKAWYENCWRPTRSPEAAVKIESSGGSLSHGKVFAINELPAANQELKIRASVLKKTVTSSDPGEESTSVFFQDDTGKLRAVALGEDAQTVYKKIEVNVEYEVSAFKIERENENIRFLSTSPWCLVLDSGTKFCKIREVERKFRFTDIGNLPSKEDLVDVIAVIKSIEVSVTKERNIVLQDENGAEAVLTLSDPKSRDLNASEGPVLAVQNAFVADKAGKHLRTCEWTCLELEPAPPRGKELVMWYRRNQNCTRQPTISNPCTTSGEKRNVATQTGGKVAARWDKVQSVNLLTAMCDHLPKLGHTREHRNYLAMWRAIALELKKKSGEQKTAEQCRSRFGTMKRPYMKYLGDREQADDTQQIRTKIRMKEEYIPLMQ